MRKQSVMTPPSFGVLGLVVLMASQSFGTSDSSYVVADSLKGLDKSKLTFSAKGVSVTLYGYAELNAAWQNHRGNYAPGDYVSFAATGKAAQTGGWAATANQSRIGFNFLSTGPTGVTFDGKLEADFYGNVASTTANGGAATQNEIAPLLELRHAYASVLFNNLGLKVLAGQANELLIPIDPSAAVGSDFGNKLINYNGLSGSGTLGTRYPQLRVSEQIALTPTASLTLAAAVQRTVGASQLYLSSSSQQPDVGYEADIPTVEGRAELSLPLWVPKKNFIIGVAGHFAQEDYLDNNSAQAHTVNSWSFASDLYLPLHKYVLINGKFAFGADLYKHCGNIGQGASYDTAGGKFTNFYRPEGLLGYVALRLNPDHQEIPLVVNLGFGVDSVYASSLKPNTAARTRNTTAYGNAYLYLNKFNFVAFEVLRIETDYLSSKTAAATDERLWRYELAYQYAF